ncbi:MAG: BMP family ABC transporter substrate-binding protein [Oscillospiraceae bacterium]|nr:BMP family ABC transporter substrate-binding protein [Oscillospiraceae bacterium]
MKKTLALLLSVIMVLALLTGCGSSASTAPAASQSTEAAPAEAAPAAESDEGYKIVLISNPASGDLGPVDAMIAGAQRAEADFGVTVKIIESLDPAGYEEDIRAMAKDGYDLIMTTFPPMQEATIAVANDYPDVKFGSIFQTSNEEGHYDNVWSTKYLGSQCTYVLGALGATVTKTNKIGYISGDQAAAVCDACNGFMRGAHAANPDVDVYFVSVESYEDPAKAKEIAKSMIAEGVDFIQTDAAGSQIGVIEAANEEGIFVSGDVSNNYDLCPDGFISYLGIDFGQNVYLAVKYLVEGTFPGGEQGVMNLAVGTYFIDQDPINALIEKADDASVLEAGKAIIDDYTAKIVSGEIEVESDLTPPSWDRIKAE